MCHTLQIFAYLTVRGLMESSSLWRNTVLSICAMKGRYCHMPLWQGIHRPADFPVFHSDDPLSIDYGLGTVLASEYDFRWYKYSLLSWALSLMGVTSIKQIIMQITAQFPSQVIAMRDMCIKLCKSNSNGFWFEGKRRSFYSGNLADQKDMPGRNKCTRGPGRGLR